jgi:hypothetical protein
LRRRREAILEREAALRLFVRDRLGEGWTPEQISGWLKSGNGPRLTARVSLAFKASIAFAVYTMRRTAAGKAKKGMTLFQNLRQAGAVAR